MNEIQIFEASEWMPDALKLAEEAYMVGEVPVGCVIIENSKIVAAGRNRTNETSNAVRHAEFEAIDQLKLTHPDMLRDRERLSSLSLIVTVEPCIMCAAALRTIGILNVYFACYNERFGGCGSILSAHRDFMPALPPLQISQLPQFRIEAVALLRKFYMRENERAPVPRKKMNRILKEVI